MLGMTQKQAQVLQFIKTFLAENGYSPSYQEIAISIGSSSLATAHKHVLGLKLRGYIEFGFNQKRSIIVLPH